MSILIKNWTNNLAFDKQYSHPRHNLSLSLCVCPSSTDEHWFLIEQQNMKEPVKVKIMAYHWMRPMQKACWALDVIAAVGFAKPHKRLHSEYTINVSFLFIAKLQRILKLIPIILRAIQTSITIPIEWQHIHTYSDWMVVESQKNSLIWEC